MVLNLDWAHFLAHHWQREHCLITSAFENWQPPITADELAGLALEDFVESRIVTRELTGAQPQPENVHWHLEHGPFLEPDFQRDDPWTLLVQAVDHYVPEVAGLKAHFLALPNWRLDDIMVSYAVDGGSVGPHFDHYDVFLLQGEGCRRWKIGQRCNAHNPLIDHPELRILEHFDCQREYLLEPGDMLYLPPGVAHWGIAEGECTTFSIGFRAPRLTDLLSRRVDAQLEQMVADRFLEDPGRPPSLRPGEITKADLAIAEASILSEMATFKDDGWFGELVTEPRGSQALSETVEATAALAEATLVAVLPEARVAWQEAADKQLLVFANGHSAVHRNEVLNALLTLCAGQPLASENLQKALGCEHTGKLIGQLREFGALYVE